MFGKRLEKVKTLNKRWLLLLIPVGLLTAVIALPTLFITMMIGSKLVGALIGPVNFWDTPSHAPSSQDVAGIYTPDDASRTEWDREHVTLSALSYIRLNEDHTLELHDMHAFDGFGESQNCQYSATGKWGLYETGSEVQLSLTSPRPNLHPTSSPAATETALSSSCSAATSPIAFIKS